MAIRKLSWITRPGNTRLPSNLHIISFMQRRKTGNMGTSIPCGDCWERIKRAGIRRLTFWNEDGEVCQIQF